MVVRHCAFATVAMLASLLSVNKKTQSYSQQNSVKSRVNITSLFRWSNCRCRWLRCCCWRRCRCWWCWRGSSRRSSGECRHFIKQHRFRRYFFYSCCYWIKWWEIQFYWFFLPVNESASIAPLSCWSLNKKISFLKTNLLKLNHNFQRSKITHNRFARSSLKNR